MKLKLPIRRKKAESEEADPSEETTEPKGVMIGKERLRFGNRLRNAPLDWFVGTASILTATGVLSAIGIMVSQDQNGTSDKPAQQTDTGVNSLQVCENYLSEDDRRLVHAEYTAERESIKKEDLNGTDLIHEAGSLTIDVENLQINHNVQFNIYLDSDELNQLVIDEPAVGISVQKLKNLNQPGGGGMPQNLMPGQYEILKLMRENVQTRKRIILIEELIMSLRMGGNHPVLLAEWAQILINLENLNKKETRLIAVLSQLQQQ